MSFRLIQVDADWLEGLLKKNAELRAQICKKDEFIGLLIHPDQYGHEVNAEIRLAAREALGRKNDE